MNFLDFINYTVLLKFLKDVLCIAGGVGLYYFIQWVVGSKKKR